jgi:hypothetical protein
MNIVIDILGLLVEGDASQIDVLLVLGKLLVLARQTEFGEGTGRILRLFALSKELHLAVLGFLLAEIEQDDGKHKLETVGLGIYVPQSALVSQEPANKDCYTLVVKPSGKKLSYKLAYTSANETYGFKGEKEWYQWLKEWKKQIEEPVKFSVSCTIR